MGLRTLWELLQGWSGRRSSTTATESLGSGEAHVSSSTESSIGSHPEKSFDIIEQYVSARRKELPVTDTLELELLRPMMEFVLASNAKRKELLKDHPQLLGDFMDDMLQRQAESLRSIHYAHLAKRIEQSRTILRLCRQRGVALAFAYIETSPKAFNSYRYIGRSLDQLEAQAKLEQF